MNRGKRSGQIGDYEIGYGKTPDYSRFQKGKSGNPKGRPKKKHKLDEPKISTQPWDMDDMIRMQLDRTITVNESGKRKKMQMREVISQAQINAAAKGNVYAQRQVLKASRDIEARDAQRAQALIEQQKVDREEEIASYQLMVDWKKTLEADWAAANEQGGEPDMPWPHPDDILLFPMSRRWRIRGPINETDLPRYNWFRAERDHLFTCAILNDAERKKASLQCLNLYPILWLSYDVRLPLRWQVRPKFEIEFFNLAILPIRQLRQLVDERWRESEFRRVLAGTSSEWDKDSYKKVNSLLEPLLRRQGYRSLREFEHAFETQGENMPWPKLEAGSI